MTLALSNPSLDISNLIVSDVPPTQAEPTHPIIQYLEAMSKIEDPANGIKTREQALNALEAVEKVISPPCVFRVISDSFPNIGFDSTRSSTHQPGASGSSRYFSHNSQIPDSDFFDKTFN